jgi:hypothetical protein
MVTIDKKNQTIAIIVLIATAYFTIFYDIFQGVLKPFIQNDALLHAITGLIGVGFGIFALKVLTERHKKSDEKSQLNNQPSEPKKDPQKDNHKSKKHLSERTKTFIVIIPIGITLIFGIFYLQGYFDPIYEYNTDFFIHDPADKNRIYHANVVLTTKLFAVNSTINAHGIVEVVNGTIPPIPIVYVIFDNSHNIPFKKIFPNFDTWYGGQINATKISDNLYVGDTKISYDMEGCYNIKVTNGSKNVEMSLIPFNQPISCNQIHIGSSEASNAQFTNKWLVVLTIFSVGIAMMTLRSYI